jgi:hypothetical protein
MQAIARIPPVANRRHPDFKGCQAAWTFSEGGSAVSTRLWHSAITPKRYILQDGAAGSRAILQHGVGYKNLTGFNFNSTDVFPAWSNGISWLVQFNQDVTGGFPRELFEVGGLIFMTEIARQVSFYNVGGTLLANSTSTITLGQEYSLGIRYDKAAGAVTFFINGKKETVTGVAAQTPSATALTTAGGTFRNAGTGQLRDLRIYNQAMPDSTFERYYTNPNAFYLPSRPPLFARPTGALGRLTPMLRAAARH